MSRENTREYTGSFFLTLTLTVSEMGQVKPNFSGTWKQNNEKSKLAPDAPVWVHKVKQKRALN